MSKQLVSGKRRLRNTYWSLVGAASATILSVQPVMAETIWDRFSTTLRKREIERNNANVHRKSESLF